MIDTCHYCGYQYHPMPVYQQTQAPGKWFTEGSEKSKPYQIYVCRQRFEFDEKSGELSIEQHDECHDKAISDGYVPRPDLTPTR